MVSCNRHCRENVNEARIEGFKDYIDSKSQKQGKKVKIYDIKFRGGKSYGRQIF